MGGGNNLRKGKERAAAQNLENGGDFPDGRPSSRYAVRRNHPWGRKVGGGETECGSKCRGERLKKIKMGERYLKFSLWLPA